MNVITKFSYLQDLLEGSAAVSIAGLTTTEANYESAIGLESAIGNKNGLAIVRS